MALDYSYDVQAQLIRIVGHGDVSVEDRAHFVRCLLDDSDLPTPSAVLINVSAVRNAPTVEDAHIIGKLIERLQSKFGDRVAIVNSTVGHVTLSHLVSFMVGGGANNVQAFVSESEALGWLRS